MLFCDEASSQFEMEESDHPITKEMAENDGWDRMVEDLGDDEGFIDHDGEEVFVQEVA